MNIYQLMEIEIHILNFYAILFFLIGAYFFIISIFSFAGKSKNTACAAPSNRFALLVAAHNEESVITKIVENLRQLKYPKEMYDIYVIADNCTDDTAVLARKAGALVYERFGDAGKGKGYALKWMFSILFHIDAKYDAVCVFDADNLISLDFLRQMDKKLQEGFEVVQCYRDIKNPFDTWITVSYAITYWLSNRLFQLPRFNLGLNNVITGSGFAVKMDTLKEMGWEVDSLTEDMEFSLQLVLKGKRIGWAHNAVIYDEQPLTLAQSWAQRKRWMKGHAKCAVKYLKPMAVKLVTEKSFKAFDSLILLIYPFLMVTGSLVFMLDFFSDILFQWVILKPYAGFYMLMYIVAFVVQNIYFLVFLKLERKANIKTLRGLLYYPIFGFTWIPIIIQGFFERNNKDWEHISHTKDIGINEIRN